MMSKTIKDAMKNPWGLIVLISIFAAVSASCTSLTREKRPHGFVIERNKESRPAWVDSPINKLLYTSSEIRFHFAIQKARDLPIAIKKSQTAAIDASFVLWLPTFEQALKEFKELSLLAKTNKTSAEFAEIKDHLAHRVHSEIAQVEDIYFERIKIDNYQESPDLEGVSEYFDVHTLVHLKPVAKDELTRQLIDQMQSARNKKIRQVGAEILKRKSAKPLKNQPARKSKAKR
jgi:hypothetical protein